MVMVSTANTSSSEHCLFSQSSKQIAMEGDKASIPRDIIVDILERLPVKSLIRFRSVCKDWENLFNTPSFIADHLHHSDHENPLLLQRLDPSFDSLGLCLADCEMNVLGVRNTSWINSLRSARVVGSSNGLLCVEHADGGSPVSLFIWNPAIREVRQVPRTINDFKGIYDTGFGFSPVVNDYKIVRIYFPEFYDENGALDLNRIYVNRVEVYSLNTGSWKEVEFGNIQSVVRLKFERVVVNGAMFWLGSKMGSWVDDDYDLVVSFDIAIEVFTLTPLPAFAYKSSDNYKLTVYENKLALLSPFVIGNSETSLIDLWVMECATGESWSWTKKYTIGPFSSKLSPLSIWRNEIVCMGYERSGLIDETECEVKYDRERAVLSMFNPTTNELKNLATDSYTLHYIIFNHTESLVPVGNTHIADPGS